MLTKINKGPFAEWRREHIFKFHGDKTEMIGQVKFCMRGGRILNILFVPLIKLLLWAYFSYRHRRTRILLQK
jgi:ligand-binding SRPBCC domain-containing protein